MDPSLFHRLDDVAIGVFDCPHSTPMLSPTGPFLVRTQDILTGVFRFEQAAQVTEETYRQRIARAEPSYGDLLYSREGTYFGIAAEVPYGARVCLGQRMVLIRSDPKKVDHRYLKYWLNSPEVAAHIHGFRDGSVAERLNLSTIRGLPVLVRSLAQQRAIASVLGALDDKIEQNRRTAQTLERLARAIFRAWFVDFEPVKAKAAGATAFPSMPQPVFDALPTRFVDSEIGPVPEGWEVKAIGDVCDLNARSVRKGEIVGEIEYINIASVTRGHLDEIERMDFADAPSRARRVIQDGDTIWSCVRPNRMSYLYLNDPPGNYFGKDAKIRCLSIPIASLTKRKDQAAQVLSWWQGIEQTSIELALDYNHVYHADITDCYGSIYTHSIAWAMHTKPTAKAKQKDKKLIGNVIDGRIQDMQQGQTNGQWNCTKTHV